MVLGEPTASVIETLSSEGLLLKQDKHLPNVVTLVTGESLRTSWWSHPKSRLVFAVLTKLSEHPDVLFTKLLYRKVTLVHRRLWPAFASVATAREPWQTHGLSSTTRALLRAVDAGDPVQAAGVAVKEIEVRLLAYTKEVHTESGRHATRLERWSVWCSRQGVTPLDSAALGRQGLEEAARHIGASPSALPWSTTSRAS